MLHKRLRRLLGLAVVAVNVAACAQAGVSPSATGAAPTTGPTGASATPAATASGGAPASQPPTTGGGTLVWASRETVDAAWALETDDAFILTTSGVGETLTRTGFDGLLEPSLATEWERSGDTTWEFTLRDGVTFHDGSDFNAEAVARALTHLLEASAPARSFNPNTFASVEAVGEDVVRLTTVEPNALVPLYVASPNTVILAEKAYAGAQIDPIQAGTGPFVMTAANVPQSFTLARNDNYWGGSVALDGAEVQLIPDGQTRATLLQTGAAQLGSSIPIPTVPTLEADNNITVVRGELARTNTLYLNNKKPPLDDVRVRQAIQSAIDVDAIANAVLEGAVTPAIGPFSPRAPWAPAGAQAITADVDKAKSLLAEAGVAEGSLTLGLWAYPSRAELPDVAVAIQGMLTEVGINADVRVADYAALEPEVLAGNFDMMLLSRSYLTDINDPASYLRSDYTCEGSYNLSHFCDEAVDSRIEEALTLDDPQARYAIYSELAERFQSEAVDVFLYHPQEIAAHRTTVQNFRIHPLEHYVLTPEISVGG